jgi:hypothetical protein
MHVHIRWPHEPRIFMLTDSDAHFVLEENQFTGLWQVWLQDRYSSDEEVVV